MTKLKSFFKLITDPGPLVVLAVAVAMLVGIAGPASAQFFNFNPFSSQPTPRQGGGGRGGGWFGGDFFQPFQPQQPKRVIQQDYSKAPPPERHDNANAPERYVLVLGDAMADWLAYGLEDAYAEQADMGVTRKIKNGSGLIKYQPKGEPADWATAAKGILAAERADAIVVMLGLNDRVPLREPAVEKTDKPDDKKAAADKTKKDAKGKDQSKEQKPGDSAAKSDDKQADTDLPQDDADNGDGPAAAPEKAARSPNGIYDFRDDRWVELYTKKIEEMIGVLKSKGVPVIWVGLPAVRGPKGTADTLFLDSLYRDVAGKAGITYVDVWDGFVDEGGRFMQKGPDFEGQPRSLRAPDGVYFTRAGARKLAHYVEREITRALAGRSAPIELPSEPATPDANAVPGQPAPRPIAGPILPLVASSVGTDQLLGGPGSRPASVDALAARTLVKGEPLIPPAGRADDFVWPRREVGREPAKEPPKEPGKEQTKPDTPVAATTPGETGPAAPALQKPKRMTVPTTPGQPPQAQSQPPGAGQAIRDFFGFGAPQQQQKPPAPHNPAPGGPPRPPGNVGRAAMQDQPAR